MRAKTAEMRGRPEEAKIEYAFIKQSLIDDAKAHKAWVVEYTKFRANMIAQKLKG
jgi:hypothetical protein